MRSSPSTSPCGTTRCGWTRRWSTTPWPAEILDEYYLLPDSVADGAAALFDRFTEQGLQVMIRDEDGLRPATPAEHGWSQD